MIPLLALLGPGCTLITDPEVAAKIGEAAVDGGEPGDTGASDSGDGDSGESGTGDTSRDSGSDIDADGDRYFVGEDCDDSDPAVHPGAAELCNMVDDDCDGETDEGVTETFWADADADGYGNAASTTSACEAPEGFVSNDDDCDDGSAASNPDSDELCNGADDNCDGEIDEDAAVDASTWFLDADGDGYGGATSTISCSAPTDYVASTTDCDDGEAGVNPGASEDCTTPDDDDCDGLLDAVDAVACTVFYEDADGDGYGAGAGECTCVASTTFSSPDGTDCDDGDPSLTALASWYYDGDGDGFGDPAFSLTWCGQPAGYLADSSDCDDADASINPDGDEVWATGADEDCDGTVDEDDAILGAWVGTVDLEYENIAYCWGTYSCSGSVTATVTADGSGGYDLSGTYTCGAAYVSAYPAGGALCTGTYYPSATFEMTWTSSSYWDGTIDCGSCTSTIATSVAVNHSISAYVTATGIGPASGHGYGCPGGDLANVTVTIELTR